MAAVTKANVIQPRLVGSVGEFSVQPLAVQAPPPPAPCIGDTWDGAATRKVDAPVTANAGTNAGTSVRLRALVSVAASLGISETTPSDIQAAAIAKIADREGDHAKLVRLFAEADALAQLQAPAAFWPQEWTDELSGLAFLARLVRDGVPSPFGHTAASYRDALVAVAQSDATVKNPLLSLVLSAACKQLHSFNWKGAQDHVAALAASPPELQRGTAWDELQSTTRDVVYSSHGWSKARWEDALKEPARQSLAAAASLLGFEVSTPADVQIEALARIAERTGKLNQLEGVFRLSSDLLPLRTQFDASAFRTTLMALIEEGFPSPMNHTRESYCAELLSVARSDAPDKNPLLVLLLRAACKATQDVDWDKDKAFVATLLAQPQELTSGTSWNALSSAARAMYGAHEWTQAKWEAALAARG